MYFSILTVTWMEQILPVLGSASSARCLDPPSRSLSPRANETNLQRYHNRLTESSSSPAKWSAGSSFSCRDATIAPQTDTLSLLIFQKENLKTTSGHAASFLNVLKTQSQCSYWRSHFFPQQGKSTAGSWAEYLVLQSEEQITLKTQRISHALSDVHIIIRKGYGNKTRSNQTQTANIKEANMVNLPF